MYYGGWGVSPLPPGGWFSSQGPCFFYWRSSFFFFLNYFIYWCPAQEFLSEKESHYSETKTKPQTQMTFLSLVHTLWFSGSAGTLLLLLFPTYQISLHIITTLWFCLWALGCWLGHFLKLVKGQASRDLGAMDLPHRPAVGRERQSETVLRPTQGGQGWWGKGSRS